MTSAELGHSVQTWQSLHGIAEYVLAGPQFAQSKTIRLRATDGGFGTVADPPLRIDGDDLVLGDGQRIAVNGHTYRTLAAATGIEARDLREVYADAPPVAVDDVIHIELSAARHLGASFAAGVSAFAGVAPGVTPVLWPEHFDLGVTVDAVNYGVSGGDSYIAQPYAYVGPHLLREGDFWNAPFGATITIHENPEFRDLLEFFRAGQALTS